MIKVLYGVRIVAEHSMCEALRETVYKMEIVLILLNVLMVHGKDADTRPKIVSLQPPLLTQAKI